MTYIPHTDFRTDFYAIAHWIRSGARVLDLGCGEGLLLSYLSETRNIVGYGVDIDDANILACLNNKINVIQGDLEFGLSIFESKSFDYVILSQTLQAMRNTNGIIKEMMRVGKEGIITFPNFGHWQNRLQIACGRMPVSKTLPYQWFDTPNVHLCTLVDFENFCGQHNVRILERRIMNRDHQIIFAPNLFGALAFYRLEQQEG
ncbi:methionine biosynthesis protein MetW [Nitrosomonadaceae bacterium]|nr:methionine biosynthesis protein MetW [Nitrosomonadaceae bacterium]